MLHKVIVAILQLYWLGNLPNLQLRYKTERCDCAKPCQLGTIAVEFSLKRIPVAKTSMRVKHQLLMGFCAECLDVKTLFMQRQDRKSTTLPEEGRQKCDRIVV
jgi:hypothetical protein